jgi:Zn-finger nucleic acid-binding protein
MNCPICNGNMLLSEKQGVETEYCPQCNEIWPKKRINKKSIQRPVSFNRPNNDGYISDNHIYNKTNDHKLIDDKRRKRELLDFSE